MFGISISEKGRFELRAFETPSLLADGDVLVRVEWVSLNRGELTFAWPAADVSAGWDASGVVVRTSVEHIRVGDRVVTWGFSGAWSEYRLAKATDLTVVPEHIPLAVAASLPVAGLTALRALRVLSPTRRSRIGVSGSSGGVGHLLKQIAAASGVEIVLLPRITHPAAECDCHRGNRWSGNPDASELTGLVDMVGGPVLEHGLARLQARTTAVLVGNASGLPTTLSTEDLIARRVALRTFDDYGDTADDLGLLVGLVSSGELTPEVRLGGAWTELLRPGVEKHLTGGKSVFEVTNSQD